jgi:hypothetical protein
VDIGYSLQKARDTLQLYHAETPIPISPLTARTPESPGRADPAVDRRPPSAIRRGAAG